MATKYPKQYNQSSKYVPPKPKWPKQYGQSATYIAPNGARSNALPGAKPAGPTAAPAGPAGPAAQGLPFDATYDQSVANANRQYDITQAGIQYQEGALKQEYGFDDVSNPFNRAAMLQKAYETGVRQRQNQAGASMYSSAFNAGETEGRFGYDQSYQGLRSAYDAKLNDFNQQRYQASVDRDSGVTGAYADRIARAPAAEDPGPPAAAPAAAAGKAVPKPAGKVLKPGQNGPPVYRGNVGTLTVNKPRKPGKYASFKVVKPKPRKKSKYGGRVL